MSHKHMPGRLLEVAARLAAAWKACEGVPTEELRPGCLRKALRRAEAAEASAYETSEAANAAAYRAHQRARAAETEAERVRNEAESRQWDREQALRDLERARERGDELDERRALDRLRWL